MNNAMVGSVAAWGAAVAPFAAAAWAAITGRAGLNAAAVARGAWLLLVGSAAGLIVVGVLLGLDGAVSTQLGPIVLRMDVLALVLVALIIGLSAVIQSFALRYLRGDPRQLWWVVWANLLTGCSAVMVSSATVVLFAAAWSAAGACLVALLLIYRGAPGAQEGARRAALRFALGDLGLAAAAIVLVAHTGRDLRLTDLGSAVENLPPVMAIGISVLLVAAALSRSSQIPFHRWLPSSLTTPTPVSALLHAGVVNAGAILVIRFSPIIGAQLVAMSVLFGAGVATLVYASAVRLVKPDVKGRLVFSTMAQMGYMMMACGLGAYPAVLLHLVAHSLFKSSLFLGAGSGIRSHSIARDWPEPIPRPRGIVAAAWLIAAAASVAAFIAATSTLGTLPSDHVTPLIVFVIVTAAVAGAKWLVAAWSPGAIVLAICGIGVLAFGYTALLDLVAAAVPLPAPTAPVSAWYVVIPLAALGMLQLATSRPTGPTRVLVPLYARLLASSAPHVSTRKELAS